MTSAAEALEETYRAVERCEAIVRAVRLAYEDYAAVSPLPAGPIALRMNTIGVLLDVAERELTFLAAQITAARYLTRDETISSPARCPAPRALPIV